MEKITSKNNQLVKDTKRLITSSRERLKQRAFVLEGARLSFDVLNSVYKVKTLLVTDDAYGKYADEVQALSQKADSVYLISDEVAQKLSDTEHTQGVFAVCGMQEGEATFGNKVLALDNVADPANVGAILRTAEALGIDSLLVYGGCDVYNPKALRASMGSVLRLTLNETDDLASTLHALHATHRIYATVPLSTATHIQDADFSVPCVCVIGNEANGVEENIKALSDALITIPMQGRAESLNAAAAAAITAWEMMR